MTEQQHQDHISISMITAGAAALAAVFFILNLGPGDMTRGANWRILAEAVLTGAATVAYGGLSLNASKSMINPMGLTGDPEILWKKGRNERVLGFFWIILVMIGFLVVIRLATPAVLGVLEPGGEMEESAAPSALECPAAGEGQPQLQEDEARAPGSPAPTRRKPGAEGEPPGPSGVDGGESARPCPPGEPDSGAPP